MMSEEVACTDQLFILDFLSCKGQAGGSSFLGHRSQEVTFPPLADKSDWIAIQKVFWDLEKKTNK